MPATSPTLSPTFVGDGGGITLVVFGDPGLNLAHQVGADVGGLREDTAANAGKQRLTAGAHAEAEHGDGHFYERERREAEHRPNPIQEAEPEGDVQKAQAHDRQAHDGPGTEGHLKALVERFAAARGSSVARQGGGLHPDEAGQTREETAGQKGKRNPFALDVQPEGHDGQQDDDDHEEHGHHLVLLAKVGVSALADVARDFLHFVGALFGLHHREEELAGENKCRDRTGQCQEPEEHEHRRSTTARSSSSAFARQCRRGLSEHCEHNCQRRPDSTPDDVPLVQDFSSFTLFACSRNRYLFGDVLA